MINFTDKDMQLIVAALMKLPAELSFDLLLKIKQHVETTKEE